MKQNGFFKSSPIQSEFTINRSIFKIFRYKHLKKSVWNHQHPEGRGTTFQNTFKNLFRDTFPTSCLLAKPQRWSKYRYGHIRKLESLKKECETCLFKLGGSPSPECCDVLGGQDFLGSAIKNSHVKINSHRFQWECENKCFFWEGSKKAKSYFDCSIVSLTRCCRKNKQKYNKNLKKTSFTWPDLKKV